MYIDISMSVFSPQVSVDVPPPAVVDGVQPLDESQTAGKGVELPSGVSSAACVPVDDSPTADNDCTQSKVTDGQNRVSFLICVS